MGIKEILQRNIGAVIGQYIVAVSELEAACVAKDAELAKLRDEIERSKSKGSRDKSKNADTERRPR